MIWRTAAIAFAVVALGLAVPVVRHLREAPATPPPIRHLQIALPANLTIGAGTDPLDAAIAPDEQQIAFVATRDGGIL